MQSLSSARLPYLFAFRGGKSSAPVLPLRVRLIAYHVPCCPSPSVIKWSFCTAANLPEIDTLHFPFPLVTSASAPSFISLSFSPIHSSPSHHPPQSPVSYTSPFPILPETLLWNIMSFKRACDRCYRFKEKCRFEDRAGESSCTPCKKSGSICTTLRSKPRQGRRPRAKCLGPNSSVHVWEVQTAPIRTSTPENSFQSAAETHSPLSSQHMQSSESSPLPTTYLSLSPHPLDSAEHLLISTPSLIKHFYLNYDMFMLGPAFAPSFRRAIQQSYKVSPLLLQDIYTAILTTIKRARRQETGFSDQPEVSEGVVSLEKLRTARIESVQDALAIISLGQTLAAFDFLNNCLGSSLILRYSLSSIQPWYDDLSRDQSLDPITITPIFWDLVHCLVKREIPVVKYRPRASHIVDRVAGLCTSLLPILHDLCIASHRLKSWGSGLFDLDCIPVQRIEQRLLSWSPEAPSDFSTTFSKQEVLAIKAQALMYRSAGLLVAHRLLNPIGTLDDIASLHASNIMLEFSQYQDSAGPDARLHHVAFPILMASLEISDVPQEVWESIPSLAVAPVCAAKMQAVVEHVWMERLCGSTSLLFDLIDTGPDFVVLT